MAVGPASPDLEHLPVSQTRPIKRQTNGRRGTPRMTIESAENLSFIGPILCNLGNQTNQNKTQKAADKWQTQNTNMITQSAEGVPLWGAISKALLHV